MNINRFIKINGTECNTTKISRFPCSNLKIDIRIKRDDLYPETGGGSKARKNNYIIKDAIKNNYNCIVSTGGLQSNHSRSLAILCASYNIKCALVIHDEHPEQAHALTGNLLLMKKAGASIRFCRKAEISTEMDEEMERMKSQGFKPLYVWGGGHCVSGSMAYYDAAMEARAQCGDWIPDYIVHASGTGTTQVGLISGYADLPTKIIGISVARDKAFGIGIIRDSLIELGKYLKKDFSKTQIDFRDDWRFGGYEKYSRELLDSIDATAQKGLILDPTYTGKAWYGLTKLIESGEILNGSKVLFWHTGGLLNLLSNPHYLSQRI